jgi:hypothetical protein
MPCTLWTDSIIGINAVKMIKVAIDEHRLKLVDKMSRARK